LILNWISADFGFQHIKGSALALGYFGPFLDDRAHQSVGSVHMPQNVSKGSRKSFYQTDFKLCCPSRPCLSFETFDFCSSQGAVVAQQNESAAAPPQPAHRVWRRRLRAAEHGALGALKGCI
jgi:hypothetical protein